MKVPRRPRESPVCHAKSNMFEEVKGEMKLAAEHEFGVYAKTVKNNDQISEEDKKYIFDQLMANFKGECTEVGMYLAMARVAHREGYPEIGLYWEKAAYEEAEHAAKFAELLGEVVTDSTKKNLEMRVEAENGATAGKFELAKLRQAVQPGAAIHDTVHEMARDEARHGKAYTRYVLDPLHFCLSISYSTVVLHFRFLPSLFLSHYTNTESDVTRSPYLLKKLPILLEYRNH